MLNSSLLVKKRKKKTRFTLLKNFHYRRDMSLLKKKSRQPLRPTRPQSIGSRAFRGGKAAGAWSDHSPPSSVKIKNEWSCTSTPHIYLHGLYREKFALYPLPERVTKQLSSGHLNILFHLFFPMYTYRAVSFLFRFGVFVLVFFFLGTGCITGTCAVTYAG